MSTRTILIHHFPMILVCTHCLYFPKKKKSTEIKLILWHHLIKAIIRLPKKVKFTAIVQPVRMPSECKPPKSVEVIAMGYGDKSLNSINSLPELSRQLMFAKLITLPWHVCREMMPFIFRESMICAANELRKQSIFMGDSGGPLVTAVNHTLIGISSTIHLGKIILNPYFSFIVFILINLFCSYIENRKCWNRRTTNISKHPLLSELDQRYYEFRFTRLLIRRMIILLAAK